VTAVLAALDRATRPTARSTIGPTVEVDLTRQVLLLAVDGRVQWGFDTSTGRVPGTTSRHPRLSQRPAVPRITRCVRVTDAAIDWLWTSNAPPLGQPVQVYE